MKHIPEFVTVDGYVIAVDTIARITPVKEERRLNMVTYEFYLVFKDIVHPGTHDSLSICRDSEQELNRIYLELKAQLTPI